MENLLIRGVKKGKGRLAAASCVGLRAPAKTLGSVHSQASSVGFSVGPVPTVPFSSWPMLLRTGPFLELSRKAWSPVARARDKRQEPVPLNHKEVVQKSNIFLGTSPRLGHGIAIFS